MEFLRVRQDAEALFPRAAEHLAELEGHLGNYESRVRFSFRPQNPSHPELSIRDKVLLVLLSITASARLTTWTIVDSLNRDMTPGMYLATRAHLELTAVVAYTLVNLRRYQKGDLSGPAFEILLDRLNLGRRHGVEDTIARSPHLEGHIEMIGVMTLLDAVDRVVDMPELKGRFRDSYEWLSEFCHPNILSRMALGHELANGVVTFARIPVMTEDNVVNALGPGNISHNIFFLCYDTIAHLIGGVPPGAIEEKQA